MKTIVGYIDGFPLYWDLEEEKRLYGDAFLHNGKPIIMDMNTNEIITFGEDLNAVRQSVAETSPFGEKSIFYRKPPPKQEEFKSDFYAGVIDYPKLCADLKRYVGDDNFIFKWSNYETAIAKSVVVKSPNERFRTTQNRKEDVPLKSVNRREVYVKGYLNKMEHHLGRFYFRIYLSDVFVKYQLSITYLDTERYVTEAVSTADPNDVILENPYKAVVLETNNYEDFKAIVEACDRDGFSVYKKDIIEEFTEIFAQATSDHLFKGLYEQAPLFVLQARSDEQKLIDIERLLRYDKEGDWSIGLMKVDGWFRDSSNAIIKLMSSFNDITNLYNFFSNNPTKLLEIYKFLNTTGRMMLCHILTGLYQVMMIKYPNGNFVTYGTYYIGKNYRTTTEVVGDKILFRQWRIHEMKGEVIPNAHAEPIITTVGSSMEDITTAENRDNLPFALVMLIDEDSGYTMYCPALYVKFLADENRKEEILELVMVSLALASIILSAGTLAAGSVPLASFVGSMAMADIVLNVTFLAMMDDGVKQVLQSTPAGAWFVEHWDTIFMVSGGMMFTAAITKGILTNGPKLLAYLDGLADSTMSSVRNFIMSAITVAVMEIKIANFVPRSLKIVSTAMEAFAKSNYLFCTIHVTKLFKVNAYLVEGRVMVKGVERQGFALLYEGEVIASGTTVEVKNQIRSIIAEGNNIKLTLHRIRAYVRWATKFEKKFHLHFDGELKLKSIRGVQELEGTGGHNHAVIGKNIKVQRYLTMPENDKPFDALISVRYKNGQWIEKQAKSSMFPRNWSINRVKQEIALVYDGMIEEGFELKWDNNKYKAPDSNGNFEIQIEIDRVGNLTNAYPFKLIKK